MEKTLVRNGSLILRSLAEAPFTGVLRTEGTDGALFVVVFHEGQIAHASRLGVTARGPVYNVRTFARIVEVVRAMLATPAEWTFEGRPVSWAAPTHDVELVLSTVEQLNAEAAVEAGMEACCGC